MFFSCCIRSDLNSLERFVWMLRCVNLFGPLTQSPSSDPEDKVQVGKKISASQMEGPGGRQLLKQILQELKAVRQMVASQEEQTPLCGLAVIIDSVFFVFYFLTILIFLTYMYVNWIYKATE